MLEQIEREIKQLIVTTVIIISCMFITIGFMATAVFIIKTYIV